MHSAEAGTSELEHGFTRIDAIDIDLRVGAHELAKETAVALPEDQCAFRACDRIDPASSGALNALPKAIVSSQR